MGQEEMCSIMEKKKMFVEILRKKKKSGFKFDRI